MALSRYSRTKIIINDSEMYDDTFENKGVRSIRQYETSVVYFPTDEDMLQVKYDTRRWKLGDKLYKIAHEVYGDSRYWWVIAQFNQRPTPSHFKLGDIYYVPLSLNQILDYFRI